MVVSEVNQIILNIRRGNYRYIGSGSSRQVFDLRNGYVIKVARNKAGTAQNRAEYIISSSDYSELFAKVIYASDNFYFIIMEKANTVNTFSWVLKYFNASCNKDLVNSTKLQYIHQKYNLLWADLFKKSSWGVINGRPVIIDYGFTRMVAKRYY
ncbi:hypothetical protein [Clostridium septicum]|uniref:Uncharacterized protein n=1 Tax=Clostridium septicum TaxID=1504 RepID=A0A9N7PK34_CLOSE|nr:hypothetical protein [Clostridium septicum]AYE35456.1 hypothetical protein CP523_14030 [Clostridium septicum]MDU1314111.1 hypothetical protein [Clostridium septicum]QAS60844.1 hypothetical protein EI377_08935 [Clostridium septicum]UEC19888.1 hypothetical protein LK444_10735 [Clostridium septicum]USS02052.1 hypothetical protein NH397_06430 [Clostridium septicum]